MEKEFDFKNIGKRMPYRTPDGFFGKMQKQVLERTQADRFNRQHIIKLIIGLKNQKLNTRKIQNIFFLHYR